MLFAGYAAVKTDPLLYTFSISCYGYKHMQALLYRLVCTDKLKLLVFVHFDASRDSHFAFEIYHISNDKHLNTLSTCKHTITLGHC